MFPLPEVRVGDPIRHEALTVFPLFSTLKEGVEYLLADEAIDAGSVTVDIPMPERFTVLLSDDHRVVVRADCNTCTGRYELSGSNLSLEPLACTRAFCGADSPDTSFLNALAADVSASRNDRTLTLSGAGMVLIFEQ